MKWLRTAMLGAGLAVLCGAACEPAQVDRADGLLVRMSKPGELEVSFSNCQGRGATYRVTVWGGQVTGPQMSRELLATTPAAATGTVPATLLLGESLATSPLVLNPWASAMLHGILANDSSYFLEVELRSRQGAPSSPTRDRLTVFAGDLAGLAPSDYLMNTGEVVHHPSLCP